MCNILGQLCPPSSSVDCGRVMVTTCPILGYFVPLFHCLDTFFHLLGKKSKNEKKKTYILMKLERD